MSEIIYEEEFYDDFFVALVKVSENKLYGVQHTTNRIYEMSLETNRQNFWGDLPAIQNRAFKLFQTAIKIKEKFYFLPFNEETIVVMHKDFTFSKIEVDNLIAESKYGKFMNAIQVGARLLMIPYGADKFIWIDIENDCVDEVVDLKDVRRKEDLFYSVTIVDDVLYMPSMTSNRIVVYNLKTDILSFLESENKEDRFSYITNFHNQLWVVLKNRFCIRCISPTNGMWEDYTEIPVDFDFYGVSCFDEKCIHKIDNCLYCFPGTANMAVKFNFDMRKITPLYEFDKYCNNDNLDKERFIFDGSILDEKKILLYYQNNTILLYDTNSHEISEHRMELYPKPAKVALNYLLSLI